MAPMPKAMPPNGAMKPATMRANSNQIGHRGSLDQGKDFLDLECSTQLVSIQEAAQTGGDHEHDENAIQEHQAAAATGNGSYHDAHGLFIHASHATENGDQDDRDGHDHERNGIDQADHPGFEAGTKIFAKIEVRQQGGSP